MHDKIFNLSQARGNSEALRKIKLVAVYVNHSVYSFDIILNIVTIKTNFESFNYKKKNQNLI